MDSFTDIGCTFTSPALQDDKVRVISVDGKERLSQLYEFRITIRHDGGWLTADEIDKLLLSPCSLSIQGDADVIQGIVREVEVKDTREGHAAVYDIVLVPTVWLLTLSKLSRLYQKLSVKGMASDVLGRYGLAEGQHFDLNVDGDPRDFAIQYHETDWNYLQRWFEHEGFFYWFEHSADGEKLVLADTNEKTKPIQGEAGLTFREAAGLERSENSIFHWRCVQQRIPARVVLKDYDYENPGLSLLGQAPVDKKLGFGTYFEYGDDFVTPAAGNALAKIRAECFLAQQRVFHGVTDCPRVHVGHTFDLIDHVDASQNTTYLITAIDHRAGILPGEGGEREIVGYRARFEAIPRTVQYRPERLTPWPSIPGLMHGHIDSDSEGKFSTLDDQGRYRVRLPFDHSGGKGEGSSTWVRMVQAYSGSGYGSHYPLHKGAEVMLAFIDGDPDRPVIVGAIPNAHTPGPSAAKNATQSAIKTASGIHVTMDDQVSKG